jgi:lysophospholipase L1-like esterase
MIAGRVLPLKAQRPAEPHWVVAWSTSHQQLGATVISNATIRMIARMTIAGNAVRVRIDNTFGHEALVVGRAYVGHRARGALIAAGSNRPVTFGGHPEISIPPGGTIMSDPVPLRVLAQQDIAISLYTPATSMKPTEHTAGVVTSYRTPDGSGDVTASEDAGAFNQTTTSIWWLKSVEVEAQPADGAVVAFGDSITDGTCSTLDAHDRWEDIVATRLTFDARGGARTTARAPAQVAIVNEGIGGNTLTRRGLEPSPESPPGLERIERDVLSHHGVRTVILFMGTNDIRRGSDAAQVTEAMSAVAAKVKASGARILAVTIIPRHSQPAGSAIPWDAARTDIRNQVNAWIRSSRLFDGVLDFSRVVNDPANPDLLLPAFNCGDGIHPSPRGYFEIGTSVDLGLLRKP